MKRSELAFNLFSILVDFVMIFVAGLAAFYLRFEISGIRPVLYALNLAEYLQVLVVVSPAQILLLALSGLYNLKGTRRFSSEFFRIIFAVSSGLLLVVIIFFFDQQAFPSRLIVLFTWLLTIVSISLGRLVLRQIQVKMLKKGVGQHRLVVIESVAITYGLVRRIETRPELGFRVVAKLASNLPAEEMLNQLEKIRMESGIDELLQSDPDVSPQTSVQVLKFCRDYGIKFNFIPNFFGTKASNIEVETVSKIPVIVLKGTPLDGWGRVMKRSMDVILSAIALVVLSPIFLVIALAIKLNSHGPVFFHQPRAMGLGQF